MCSTTENDNLYTYTIDVQDRIVEVSANWDGFAVANQGAAALREKILHHSLWEFIADPETAHLYEALLNKVRSQGISVEFPFRCDSPECRRFMKMRIEPLSDSTVLFKSRIKRKEPREPITLLAPGTARNERILLICGWCKSIKCGSHWLPLEEALKTLGLMKHRTLPKLSHGICESCRRVIKEQLAC